jgi:hypothetical protein
VVGDVIDKFFNNNNVVSGGGSVTGEIGQTANDGESVVKSITANVINGIPQLEQHVWKAKLTQSGTDPIVIESVMIDTVGFNITSDYSGVGMYSLSGFDLTDFGFPNTFDEVNYEINNSMGLEDKFDVSYYCEGTTIFIDTFRNNSHHDNVIPNSTARSFIITVTLYI